MDELLTPGPAGQARDFDYNRFVDFIRLGVQPPSRVYVTRDDRIILRIWSPIAALAWRVSIRWQDPEGRIVPQFLNGSNTTSGATPATIVLSSAEGYLLSATVETSNTTQLTAYASLEILRGAGTSDQTRGQVILCGIVPITGALSFPQALNTSPLFGRGTVRSFAVAAAGAGFEFTQAVPNGVSWILRAVTAVFHASAAVANRLPALILLDPTFATVSFNPISGVITASSVTTISWAPGMNPFLLIGTAATAAMPAEVRLGPGWFIGSQTALLDAGDSYTGVKLIVEEFINA